MMNELKTNIRLKAPDELKQNVLQHIEALQDAQQVVGTPPRRRTPTRVVALRWLAVAAAVAAVAIIIPLTSTDKPTDADILASKETATTPPTSTSKPTATDILASKETATTPPASTSKPTDADILASKDVVSPRPKPVVAIATTASLQPTTASPQPTTASSQPTTPSSQPTTASSQPTTASLQPVPSVSPVPSVAVSQQPLSSPHPLTPYEQQLLDRLAKNRDLVIACLADELQQASLTQQHIRQAAYDNMQQLRRTIEENLLESLPFKQEKEPRMI